MPARPHAAEWESVRSGDRVALTLADGSVIAGTIDAMTGDRETVWTTEKGLGRRMIHPGDGIAVCRILG